MSEKFPSQPEGRRVTHVDGGTFKDKAESLSVHRAALLWRNYLVRMQNNVGSYASRGQLLREIQEAAALESRGDVTDPKHVALVLPVGETAESMREKLLEYLKNVGPLSGEDALATQVAEREVRVVRARFLESMYVLDRCIGQLQSQGRTNTNIPDVLYRQ